MARGRGNGVFWCRGRAIARGIREWTRNNSPRGVRGGKRAGVGVFPAEGACRGPFVPEPPYSHPRSGLNLTFFGSCFNTLVSGVGGTSDLSHVSSKIGLFFVVPARKSSSASAIVGEKQRGF